MSSFSERLGFTQPKPIVYNEELPAHGVVEARGEDGFEASVRGAVSVLADSGRMTASGRIREAFDDLSAGRKPILPEQSNHSIAVVECVCPLLEAGVIFTRVNR